MEARTDILDYLKNRQRELERIAHPLAEYSDTFRYLYCFGLGTMAVGNMKAITELQEYFETVLDGIYLPQNSREQIIVDINNYFDLRTTECIKAIGGKKEQYCFILDLYRIYRLSLWSEEYCRGVLECFLQIFHLSDAEKSFLKDFSDAAGEKNRSSAERAYQSFVKSGYDIDYSVLTYFFEDFSLYEEYGDIVVEAGKTIIIDKPAIIDGNVTVERGGSLLIHGGAVKINGYIDVYGGRIQVKDAKITVVNCSRGYLMELHDTAVVQITKSYIDCGYYCGLLNQDMGRLIVSESSIYATDRERAICFHGRSSIISKCDFSKNLKGSVDIFGAARMNIYDCRFTEAQAEYGGAIRSESIGNVKFDRCHFVGCKAKYLGSAVYFKYQKFGQYVRACSCIECIPEDNPIFNVYDDDFEMNVLKRGGDDFDS